MLKGHLKLPRSYQVPGGCNDPRGTQLSAAAHASLMLPALLPPLTLLWVSSQLGFGWENETMGNVSPR